MAWIEKRTLGDGTTSAQVRFRLGGRRNAPMQAETFSAGSDQQNVARAEGFKKMVDAAGQRWPEGWVRGKGFVRPHNDDPYSPPLSFAEVAEAYARQIVDISPGHRKRILSQVRILTTVDVRGEKPFEAAITAIAEADIKAWLTGWDRSLKTKANYHGLLFGIFNYAIEEGHLTVNPCLRTAPKRARVKQTQAELRFLTEDEFATVVRLAGTISDLLTTTVGTGLRFGEITALWCGDIDLTHRTLRVNKAWKRNGEDGETETPAWLKKMVKPKHKMQQDHFGNPKTLRSRRTISISPALVDLLRPHVEGRAADDFVFVNKAGNAIRHSTFHLYHWQPLMARLLDEGINPFRFHDLRHTHVAWLIAGGAPLPHIQARLGHESIPTTIDTYGHLLPAGDELISEIIDAAIGGGRIRPVIRLVRAANEPHEAAR